MANTNRNSRTRVTHSTVSVADARTELLTSLNVDISSDSIAVAAHRKLDRYRELEIELNGRLEATKAKIARLESALAQFYAVGG